MTNETGRVLNPLNRYQPPFTLEPILAHAWPGYNRAFEQYSFQIPLATNIMFLTNSTYQNASAQFVPATGAFELGFPSLLYSALVDHVKARLRFAMVDTSANPTRIVDYVDLADQTLVNLTDTLTEGGNCGTSYRPDGSLRQHVVHEPLSDR